MTIQSDDNGAEAHSDHPGSETTCQACGGTGKRWVWRTEGDPRFNGFCTPCFGTGRVSRPNGERTEPTQDSESA